MRWLRTLHLYAGLVIGVFLLIFALTGGVLIFKEDIWRLQYPALDEPLAPLAAEDHAAAFQRIAAEFPQQVRTIRTPQPGLAAYHVYLQDGEAFVHPTDHRLIAAWRWYQSPIGILTELHIRLAAGRPGRTAGGVTALAASLMAVSGLVLWWPVRRTFSVRHLWPESMKRVHLLMLHRDLGMLASPLVVLFTLTAAGIVFYPQTTALLNGLFSDRAPPAPPAAVASAAPGATSSAAPGTALVRAAQDALPHARLMSYNPPPPGQGVHYFRFREPQEIHPNGRSVVYVDDASGSVLQAVAASRQPLGERLAHALFPLHAARLGGAAYTALGVVAALALAAISLVGPLSYLKSRRRARRAPARS